MIEVLLKLVSRESLAKELCRRNGVEFIELDCADGVCRLMTVHGWKE